MLWGAGFFMQGIEISVVSKLLGHADINTTYGKYIHVVQNQIGQTAAQIPKI